MIFEKCEIEDVIKITPKRHTDARGYFVEVFREDLFKTHIGAFAFTQYNQSLSHKSGTVRGLHYQMPPAAQGKLVRCVRGRLLDVAVDIRRSQPTYGRHVAVELSADDDTQLWIPPGFAHGFCTLEPDTEIWYAVTHGYSPAHDRGLFWNDPDLNIDWPVDAAAASLSQRDFEHPALRDLAPDFV